MWCLLLLCCGFSLGFGCFFFFAVAQISSCLQLMPEDEERCSLQAGFCNKGYKIKSEH